MSKLVRTLSIAAVALAVVPAARAQTAKSPAAPAQAAASTASPFAGTWELNLAKSDLGPAAAQAPSKVTLTITRTGNVLTLAQALTMGGRDINASTDYALTGRDTTTNAPDGLPVTNNASMSDTVTTITSKLQRQGMDITMMNHWTLSSDRKVMMVRQETTTPMGAMKMTMWYDRKQ